MESKSNVAQDEGHDQLLSPSALVAHAAEKLSEISDERVALMMIALNRSDRVAALAQDRLARGVLIEAARRVEAVLRPHDRFAICSISEIWVVLSGLSNEAVASLAANAIREALSEPILIERDGEFVRSVKMGPAIGVVWAKCGTVDDIESLLYAADDARNSALRSEARMHVTEAASHSTKQRKNELEAELRGALLGNEMTVYLQPQVDVSTQRCVSAEALIRWTRSNGEAVNPQLIAELCEEFGLIDALTRFVMNTSLRAITEFDAQGIQIDIGINLAAPTLSDANFPEEIEQAALTWSVSPSRLTFELTESSIVKNEQAGIEFMHRLRDLGCALSIDDFGTGYSSLSYLREFPLSELKIDRAFVMQLASNRSDQQIVKATIELAHSFGLRCVAEGVEDAAALEILKNLGCDVAQGYLVSKPMPIEQFSIWYKKWQLDAMHRLAEQSPAGSSSPAPSQPTASIR